jgi:hypothetical protein
VCRYSLDVASIAPQLADVLTQRAAQKVQERQAAAAAAAGGGAASQ